MSSLHSSWPALLGVLRSCLRHPRLSYAAPPALRLGRSLAGWAPRGRNPCVLVLTDYFSGRLGMIQVGSATRDAVRVANAPRLSYSHACPAGFLTGSGQGFDAKLLKHLCPGGTWRPEGENPPIQFSGKRYRCALHEEAVPRPSPGSTKQQGREWHALWLTTGRNFAWKCVSTLDNYPPYTCWRVV